MKYYKIDPDVPGRLGSETVKKINRGDHNSPVEYIFECWPDDALVQADPIFLARSDLSQDLSEAQLTGVEYGSCFATKGEQFSIASPQAPPLPRFNWLKINGIPYQDDFGLDRDFRLVISDRTMGVINRYNLINCTIEPI